MLNVEMTAKGFYEEVIAAGFGGWMIMLGPAERKGHYNQTNFNF